MVVVVRPADQRNAESEAPPGNKMQFIPIRLVAVNARLFHDRNVAPV
jgi:hypothetical protein